MKMWTVCRSEIRLHFVLSSVRKELRHASVARAELHSSVGSVQTGDCWFDPRLGQFSFRRLMIVTATGFIPPSPLSVVLTLNRWESSQWLEKNIVQSTGLKNFRKAWIVALAAAI